MTEQPDSYEEIRDDLDSLMGSLESAAGLACFIVMEGLEHGETPRVPGPDFTKSLHSLHHLLEYLKRDGDGLVHRMMELESADT